MKSGIFGLALGAGLVVALAGVANASPALTLKAGPLLSGPGTDYAKLVDLPAEMHVDIVWCGTHDNWCLVSEHNKLGWLPLALLKTHVGRGQTAVAEGGQSHPGGPAVVVGPGSDGSEPVAAALDGDNPRFNDHSMSSLAGTIGKGSGITVTNGMVLGVKH